MSTLRELKSRIGSVASTQKTTSAMKMISSAKMRKATQQLQRLSPYRVMVQNVISHLLVTDEQFDSPLIEQREVKRVALVAFGSDDGLCGAFNINIFKQLMATVDGIRKEFGPQVGVTILPVGRKLTKASLKVAGDELQVVPCDYLNTRSDSDDLNRFTNELRTHYLQGDYDRVELLYMHFRSASRQVFTREQLLPVRYEALAEQVDARLANSPCLFELIFVMLTQSAASEQSARVMAMQTASDNAKELLDSLNLEYNKLRQQGITTELLDILGGQVER